MPRTGVTSETKVQQHSSHIAVESLAKLTDPMVVSAGRQLDEANEDIHQSFGKNMDSQQMPRAPPQIDIAPERIPA